MKKKIHRHSWIYDGKSCCHRLKCKLPGCEVRTSAYYIKGPLPKIGDRVQFVKEDSYGQTIEIVVK